MDIDSEETIRNVDIDQEYNFGSNYFEAEYMMRAQERRDNKESDRTERLGKEIGKVIVNFRDKLMKQVDVIGYIDENMSMFVDLAKRNLEHAEREQKIPPYMEFLVEDIVGHGGYLNLDEIWFDSPSGVKIKEDESTFWRELNERINELIDLIFPGLFREDNQMDYIIKKTGRAQKLLKGHHLLKGYTNRFPLNREEFEAMIKCRVKNRFMHLVDLVHRGYQEARSRAITKHFQQLITRPRQRHFERIKYLQVDGEGSSGNLIYNPTSNQVEQFGADKLRTGYVLKSYSDINKCPLFDLSDAKCTESAVRKYLNAGNLYNPNDIYDYFRATVLFPDDNRLTAEEYACESDLERECLRLYKNIKDEVGDRDKVYDFLVKEDNLSGEKGEVIEKIHQHYTEQDRKRRNKIRHALAKLIGFVGSTHYPDRTRDGFRNGKTNRFSGPIPRYNLTFTYRPTYNREDVVGISKELEELINSSKKLKQIVENVVNMFRGVEKDSTLTVYPQIFTNRGTLHYIVKRRLLRERSKDEPDSELIECYQKAIYLMEELSEITRNNNTRPYLRMKKEESGSVYVEAPEFRNFSRSPGTPIPFEIQFRDYIPEEEYEKDHKQYTARKNISIAGSFGVDKVSETGYRVMDFSKFISDLVDAFCVGYDFPAYDKTVKAWDTSKDSRLQKPLSARENIKFWLLKILAREENKDIIKDILSDVVLRQVRLREFLRLIEDEMGDVAQFRRCQKYKKWLKIVKNRLVECHQELMEERKAVSAES